MTNIVPLVILLMAFAVAANAQVERMVIGQNGMEWRQSSEDLLGLDDSVAIGSLQPFELNPLVNIAVGAQTKKGQLTNILGYVWGTSPRGPPASVKDKHAGCTEAGAPLWPSMATSINLRTAGSSAATLSIWV